MHVINKYALVLCDMVRITKYQINFESGTINDIIF
jgi:hypothetical protein